MRYLHLSEAGHIEIKQLKNEMLHSRVCREALETYRKNLWLAVAAVQVPTFFSFNFVLYSKAENDAYIKVLGPDYAAKLKTASKDDLERAYEQTRANMAALDNEFKPKTEENMKSTSIRLEGMAVSFGEDMFDLLESVLKFACIQTWTAMEVLFEDLLTNSVDAYPSIFPAADSSKLRFRRLGDYTKDRRGVLFWYNKTLSGDAIINALLANDDILALSEVRHILVHKGGKVDGDFTRKTKHIPKLARYTDNPPVLAIPFDGEMLREIVDPAIAQGYKLIAEMDRWLNDNKSPTAIL